MKYYQLYGAVIGLFPEWTNYGWFYATPQHASEILGYLLQAGGQRYTFAMSDVQGIPVAPMMPQPQGVPGGVPASPFPNFPGWGGQWGDYTGIRQQTFTA